MLSQQKLIGNAPDFSELLLVNSLSFQISSQGLSNGTIPGNSAEVAARYYREQKVYVLTIDASAVWKPPLLMPIRPTCW